MDTDSKKQARVEDIDDNEKMTLLAKDLKIMLSVLSAGASRGLFKPEEFSLIGQLNDNVRKSLTGK